MQVKSLNTYLTDHLITEGYRILRPNGIIIISTPNLASWVNRILLLFGLQPFDAEVSQRKCYGLPLRSKQEWKPVGHLRCFSVKALKQLLNSHNFSIVKTQWVSSRTPFFGLRFIDNICDKISPSFSRTTIIVAKK